LIIPEIFGRMFTPSTHFLVLAQMPSDSERIAILETKAESIQQTLMRVDGNVADVKEAMSKQKGFIGGVMFIMAPISVLLAVIAKEVWHIISQ
jgi:hypothetical protein